MINESGLFGMAAGILTTVTLQPLENIKMALMIPPKDLKMSHNFLTNVQRASNYIYKVDGWKGFYKGLVAGTQKAALGCYIYFSSLRYLQGEDELQQTASRKFAASSVARIMSTLLTNPLSIIETRFQLADFHQYKSVRGAIKDIYVKEGLAAFFSGALASCIKEGIFAGCYYAIYEEFKDYNVSRFPAGIMSGILSTALTHPFEIIRARLQVSGLTEKHKVSEHLILREIGFMKVSGGWFKGLTPRLVKKPLANTLTFLLFQLMEQIKEKKELQV